MDLSKAFGTINHEFFIAKLHAYDLDKAVSNLQFFYYLNNRWHRTYINQTFSSWEELIQAVPQLSVLGPFHFDIYLCVNP